jgi:hypothetical protein
MADKKVVEQSEEIVEPSIIMMPQEQMPKLMRSIGLIGQYQLINRRSISVYQLIGWWGWSVG